MSGRGGVALGDKANQICYYSPVKPSHNWGNEFKCCGDKLPGEVMVLCISVCKSDHIHWREFLVGPGILHNSECVLRNHLMVAKIFPVRVGVRATPKRPPTSLPSMAKCRCAYVCAMNTLLSGPL